MTSGITVAPTLAVVSRNSNYEWIQQGKKSVRFEVSDAVREFQVKIYVRVLAADAVLNSFPIQKIVHRSTPGVPIGQRFYKLGDGQTSVRALWEPGAMLYEFTTTESIAEHRVDVLFVNRMHEQDRRVGG